MTPSSSGGGSGFPAPLPEMEVLTARNEARLIWWAIRFSFQGARGGWLAAVVIATATFGAWTILPFGVSAVVVTIALVAVWLVVGAMMLVAVAQLLTNAHRRRRGWLVGYFTADASQLVHPNHAGAWILSDHFARRRGHGLAAAFRRRVFTHLAAEADRHQVVIVMETHAEKLAHIYTQDMPELRVVAKRRTINGPTWSLQRDPQPVSP